MKQSALGSVFFFQKMGIGLDNYKGKESLSRVVKILTICLEKMALSLKVKQLGKMVRLKELILKILHQEKDQAKFIIMNLIIRNGIWMLMK